MRNNVTKSIAITKKEIFKCIAAITALVISISLLSKMFPKAYCRYCDSELCDLDGTLWCESCQRRG